jgi:hypothetical protein
MKKGASKYVMEHDLEESTPGDDNESLSIRPPHQEYDAYQIDIDYSNALLKDIDMICRFDDNNRVGNAPDKIHERTKSKQERNKRLIAASMDLTKVLALVIGNNSDPQSVIAFLTFDMHRFVGDTTMTTTEMMMKIMTIALIAVTFTKKEKKKRKKKKESKIYENTQHKKPISTPDSSEWGTCPNCKGCGFVETCVPNATKMK